MYVLFIASDYVFVAPHNTHYVTHPCRVTIMHVHVVCFDMHVLFIASDYVFAIPHTAHTMQHVPSQNKSHASNYGLATDCRLVKIISLFGEHRSLFKGFRAKETCNFKEPTNRSHLIEETFVKIDDHIQFSMANRVAKSLVKFDLPYID